MEYVEHWCVINGKTSKHNAKNGSLFPHSCDVVDKWLMMKITYATANKQAEDNFMGSCNQIS